MNLRAMSNPVRAEKGGGLLANSGDVTNNDREERGGGRRQWERACAGSCNRFLSSIIEKRLHSNNNSGN